MMKVSMLSTRCMRLLDKMKSAVIHHLIIRPLVQKDISSLLAIERQSEYAPWQRRHFEKEISNAFTSRSSILTAVIQAENSETVAGYICFRALWEEVYILKVAVSRIFRMNGVATALMKQVVNQGIENGAERMVLEVAASNANALKLYRKIGFDFVENAKLSNDSLIMVKKL